MSSIHDISLYSLVKRLVHFDEFETKLTKDDIALLYNVCWCHVDVFFWKEICFAKDLSFSVLECEEYLRLTMLFKSIGMKQTFVVQQKDDKCLINSSKPFGRQAYKFNRESIMYNMDSLFIDGKDLEKLL